MNYVRDTIRVNSRTLVALRFVESMSAPSDDDLVVDILKDDLQIDIVTTSGREYKVSMTELAEYMNYSDGRYIDWDKAQLRDAVYARWIYLIGKGTKK